MRTVAIICACVSLLSIYNNALGQTYVLEFETPSGYGLGYRTSFYNADWNWSVDRLDLEGDGVLELLTHSSSTNHLQVYDGATHALKWDHDLAENDGPIAFLGFYDIDADGQREAVFDDDDAENNRLVIVDVQLDAIEFSLDGVLFTTILDIDNDSHPELIVQTSGDRAQIWGAGTSTAVPPAADARINSSVVYPNPFLARTTIEFDVPRSGMETTLRLYDSQGRVVRTLIQRPMQVGRHTVAWDGRDDAGRAAAAGVYLYKVAVGSFKAEGKAVLQ